MVNTNPRQYSAIDNLLTMVENCLSASLANSANTRPNPARNVPEADLTSKQQRHSAALMRINHSGEVCAQALYLGQSLTARSLEVSNKLQNAAQEEIDHLAWCKQRISELNSHTSFLNPLWFIGSLAIGSFAGLVGDKWSLGFLAETENQVFNHLQDHLEQLPEQDEKSRKIVETMQLEEAEHAFTAQQLGAAELPTVVQVAMSYMSKVMTKTTYFL